MAFQLYIEQLAYEKMSCPDFSHKWQALFDDCPWSTVFQSQSFSRTWFDIYGEDFIPVIMTEDNNDQLDHLVIFGWNSQDNKLVHCGAHQAEYQCWLSRDFDFSDFVNNVLFESHKLNPSGLLEFKFLPTALTTHLNSNKKSLQNNFILRNEKKLTIQFDVEPAPWASMSKKNNKYQLAQMRKLGDVKLELLDFNSEDGQNEVDDLLNQIIPYYDLRQGAISDCCPFLEDNKKIHFYQKLLSETQEFQALVFKNGDKISACAVGSVENKELSFGIFCFNFLLSKYSPGKLLLFMGSKMLAEKGLTSIDLTPGGQWKERFANDAETVSKLTIYYKSSRYFSTTSQDTVIKFSKLMLAKLGHSPGDVRNFIKTKIISRISNIFTKNSEDTKTLHLYKLHIQKEKLLPATDDFERNDIREFLKFSTKSNEISRQAFLSDSLRRFEAGHTGYSYTKNNQLLITGWLAPVQKKSYFPEVDQVYVYEEPSTVLTTSYRDTTNIDASLLKNIILCMLHDSKNYGESQTIYFTVSAGDKNLKVILKEIGFEFVESIKGKE